MRFMDQPDSQPINPYESPAAEVSASNGGSSNAAAGVGLRRPIEIEGALSLTDAFHAVLSPRRKVSLVLWFGVVLLWSVSAFGSTGSLLSGFTSEHVFLFGMATFGVLYFLLPVFAAWRQWTRRTGMCEPHRRVISEENITSTTSSITATMQWSYFSKYRHTKRMARLYLNPPRMFLVVPRAFFKSDDDWHSFLELLSRKLPRSGKAGR